MCGWGGADSGGGNTKGVCLTNPLLAGVRHGSARDPGRHLPPLLLPSTVPTQVSVSELSCARRVDGHVVRLLRQWEWGELGVERGEQREERREREGGRVVSRESWQSGIL